MISVLHIVVTDYGRHGSPWAYWADGAARPRCAGPYTYVPVNRDFQVFSGMVLDGESLYGQWASCDNNHAGVAAIDLATGHVRWRSDTLYQGETLPNALPQSALGGVYVTGGGGMNESDHGVAVDIANGKVRWTKKLGDQPALGGLALDQAVDRATGQVLWTSPLPTGAATWSSIAADDDDIYAKIKPGYPLDARARRRDTSRANSAGH